MQHTIYAQKLTGAGTRDGEAYVVRAPILNNTDPTDDGFGQVGMAYDPAANQFEVAARGSDIGGLAPLWRFRLGSDALTKNMNPVRVDSGTSKLDPTVVADTTGNFLIVYRLDFTRIAATLISGRCRAGGHRKRPDDTERRGHHRWHPGTDSWCDPYGRADCRDEVGPAVRRRGHLGV